MRGDDSEARPDLAACQIRISLAASPNVPSANGSRLQTTGVVPCPIGSPTERIDLRLDRPEWVNTDVAEASYNWPGRDLLLRREQYSAVAGAEP